MEGYMLNETIAIYAIIDDLLKAIGHRDDCRRKMSDAEIITTADVRGLKALPLNLPQGSEVYGDAAYTDYTSEDDLKDSSQIELQVMRKRNSTRQDPPWTSYVKQSTRHYIETVFSGITRVFPKSIHAVTLDGFLLKLSAFIFAFTLKTAFINSTQLKQ
jgi:hypothetical protein